MDNDLERTLRMNYLYDFYHELLTSKQQDYVRLYYLMDLQFSEIAEELDVTRQAVYDNLKRTTELLEQYEASLGMYRMYLKRTQLIETLKTELNDCENQNIAHIIKALEALN